MRHGGEEGEGLAHVSRCVDLLLLSQGMGFGLLQVGTLLYAVAWLVCS